MSTCPLSLRLARCQAEGKPVTLWCEHGTYTGRVEMVWASCVIVDCVHKDGRLWAIDIDAIAYLATY